MKDERDVARPGRSQHAASARNQTGGEATHRHAGRGRTSPHRLCLIDPHTAPPCSGGGAEREPRRAKPRTAAWPRVGPTSAGLPVGGGASQPPMPVMGGERCLRWRAFAWGRASGPARRKAQGAQGRRRRMASGTQSRRAHGGDGAPQATRRNRIVSRAGSRRGKLSPGLARRKARVSPGLRPVRQHPQRLMKGALERAFTLTARYSNRRRHRCPSAARRQPLARRSEHQAQASSRVHGPGSRARLTGPARFGSRCAG